MTVPRCLTLLTAFVICAGYAYNVGVLLQGGRVMACDHIHAAACEWPVLAFGVGVLYGANVIEWAKVNPWAALIATFFLSHLTYPLR